MTTTYRWRRWCRQFRSGVQAVRVEMNGEKDQGEEMTLGEDEGRTDDKRVRRCAECT
jgi:hypothetical protein